MGKNNLKIIVVVLIGSTTLWLRILFTDSFNLLLEYFIFVLIGIGLGVIGIILGVYELGWFPKEFKMEPNIGLLEVIKSKTKTTKQKTLLAATVFWIILVVALIPIYYDWSQKTLNDEIGIWSLPAFDDENTTLQVQIMDREVTPGYYTESDSEILTSDNALRIRIDYKSGSLLNICYVEILVNNGTSAESLNGWSLNISGGNPEGTTAGTQYITIPPQKSNSLVVFKVRLWSTSWNETSRTLTALNDMEFSYVVYYSNSEISIDVGERIVTRNFLLLDVFLLFLFIIFTSFVPTLLTEEDEIKQGATPKGVADWAKYIGSRIDNLDQSRHNLTIQTQFLVTILSVIATFSADNQFVTQIIPIVVILSFPLVISILILMAGPRVVNVERIASTDSKTSLNALREDLKIKSNFLQNVKKFVGGSSMYAIAVVLFSSVPQNPVYEIFMVYTTYFLCISLCLLNLYIIGLITYRHFAYPRQ